MWKKKRFFSEAVIALIVDAKLVMDAKRETTLLFHYSSFHFMSLVSQSFANHCLITGSLPSTTK